MGERAIQVDAAAGARRQGDGATLGVVNLSDLYVAAVGGQVDGARAVVDETAHADRANAG